MAEPRPPEPVKWIAAVLWSDESSGRQVLEQALQRLAAQFGPLDYQGPDVPFDVTDYYVPEMGGNLQRRLIAHRSLGSPDGLAAAKLFANAVEAELAACADSAATGDAGEAPRRPVNIDFGFLDLHKIVLASAKPAGQKIYLNSGIYADLIARYAQGHYQPLPWCFPDFKDGRYDEQLLEIRRIFQQQLRERRKAPGPNTLPK